MPPGSTTASTPEKGRTEPQARQNSCMQSRGVGGEGIGGGGTQRKGKERGSPQRCRCVTSAALLVSRTVHSTAFTKIAGW